MCWQLDGSGLTNWGFLHKVIYLRWDLPLHSFSSEWFQAIKLGLFSCSQGLSRSQGHQWWVSCLSTDSSKETVFSPDAPPTLLMCACKQFPLVTYLSLLIVVCYWCCHQMKSYVQPKHWLHMHYLVCAGSHCSYCCLNWSHLTILYPLIPVW